MDAGSAWIRRAVHFFTGISIGLAFFTMVGAIANGDAGRLCDGLLFFAARLCGARRKTPRYEPAVVDNGGDSDSQCTGTCSLFRPAATTARYLSAMWQRNPSGLQLLPALQPQTEPKLSAVPSVGWRKRSILSALRSFGQRSAGCGIGGSPRSIQMTRATCAVVDGQR